MTKVQVLLSTYNGERFLLEQLDSLRRQKNVSLNVLARDDGSSDQSLEILKNYAHKWPALKILEDGGQNLGVVSSFFTLLKNSDPECEIYAFCDQDDVWLPEKISAAAQMLASEKISPALYFSRLIYVDSILHEIGQSQTPVEIKFGNALIENLATGCSVVFNKALLRKVLTRLPREHCLMHDWWLYLAASALGKVYFDTKPHILYRQHGANVVGATTGFFARYWLKLRRFSRRSPGATHVSDQAREFGRCFDSDLSPAQRHLIRDLVNSKHGSFITRLTYACHLPLRRQRFLDNLLFRVLILLGRY